MTVKDFATTITDSGWASGRDISSSSPRVTVAYRRSTVLDQLLDSGLDDEEKRTILSSNIARILRIT